MRICRICLVIGIISYIQICISEYRAKLYITCCIIERSNHDRICPCTFVKISISGIHSKQSNICITAHSPFVISALYLLSYFIIDCSFDNAGLIVRICKIKLVNNKQYCDKRDHNCYLNSEKELHIALFLTFLTSFIRHPVIISAAGPSIICHFSITLSNMLSYNS